MWLEHNELGRMWKDADVTKPEFVWRGRGKAQKRLFRLTRLQARYETQELVNNARGMLTTSQ